MDKRTQRFAATAVLLGVAGYVAGVLTAPKSGKETRKDIKDTATSKAREAEKQLKKAHTELSQLISKTSDKTASLKGKAKQEVEMLLDKAKKAKSNTREALSNVRDGQTTDDDLQKAIDEAEKAVDHLKKFLKK